METKIQIDWADEISNSPINSLTAKCVKHGVQHRIIKMIGPTDWPFVEISGTYDAVHAFYVDYNGGDDTDFDIFLVS